MSDPMAAYIGWRFWRKRKMRFMQHDENTQLVLSEIRKLNGKFDELSLQVRVDTPWVRFKSQVRYALHTLQEIPLAARVFTMMALTAFSVSIFFSMSEEAKKKIRMSALDLLGLALLCVGYD